MSNKSLSRRVPMWMALPSVFLYSLLVVLPAFLSIYYSLTNWDGLSPKMTFIGLRNYVDLASDERFWNAFKNSVVLAVVSSVTSNIVALALALLVNRIRKLTTLCRSAFYLPNLLSGIVSGYIWVSLLNYSFGVVNQLLNAIGFESVDFLGNPGLALWTVIFVITWKGAGYYMIIYIAGLNNISTDILEAADIDGCSAWSKFIRVTVPMLTGSFTINLTLSIINGLKIFDQIVSMTSGGPGFATETLTYQIYTVAFSEGRQGYGTAVAMVLFLLTLLLSVLNTKLTRHFEVEG